MSDFRHSLSFINRPAEKDNDLHPEVKEFLNEETAAIRNDVDFLIKLCKQFASSPRKFIGEQKNLLRLAMESVKKHLK